MSAGRERPHRPALHPGHAQHILIRAVLGKPLDESAQDSARTLAEVPFWQTPGVWLRLKLPLWTQMTLGPLDLFQWPGLPLVLLGSWLAAWLTLTVVCRVTTWLLRSPV